MTSVYDPNWNPDDYDMTLKYECVNPSKVDSIVTRYKHDEVLDYIKDLYKLIEYQRKLIKEQRKEIIAIKHKLAWNRYDKEIDINDPINRSSVDKPKRTDTMGC